MRCLVWFVLPALSLAITGCGETEAQRLERMVPNALDTTKVTGNVTVDGEAVKDLWVTLHPKDPKQPLRPRGQTDGNGYFKITTYTGGDGAPEGDYTITIEWLKYIPSSSDWGGPDKLKNQYNNPKTTPFKVTVGDTSIALPPFELKVAGVPDTAAPVNVTKLKKPER